MKKILILLLLLFAFNISNAQQIMGTEKHVPGRSYKINELVVSGGAIYKALTDNSTTPPDANWEDITAGGGGGGTDDQIAAEVPFTPYLTIASTDVQTAIQELLDEAGVGIYLPLTGGVLSGNLKAPSYEFDTASPGTLGEGILSWNVDEGTMDLGLLGGNVSLQAGQEMVSYVKAVEGISDGDVVYASGAVGISSKIEVSKYIANNTIQELQLLGVATEAITIGNFGYITVFGKVRGIPTDGTAESETWLEGDILYSSPTTAGKLTKVLPVAPNQAIPVAMVISVHASNGTLMIRPSHGYHLGELHDIEITTIQDKDALIWNNANSRWENKQLVEADISDLTHTADTNTQLAIATSGEVDTGTDNTKAISPLALAGSTLQSNVTTNNAKVTFPGFTSLFTDYGFTDNSSTWDALVTDDDLGVPGIYGIGWDANNDSPTKNDVYDKIEAVILGGGGEGTTVSDTPEIDLTLTGADITADIVLGSIDETKLDTSTNTSLNLADTSTQPGDNLSTLVDNLGHIEESTTVSDTAELDLTLTGVNITGSILASSIDETKLDTSTNASLDLADSALQSEVDGSISNELQTIANTSAATTHTATLSDTGGSLQLVEGANITLTTTGTALDGIVTIAATSSGADGLGPDGDKGDITVGGTGTTLTIDAGAIDETQLDVSTNASCWSN
jgi:hypothetical protein